MYTDRLARGKTLERSIDTHVRFGKLERYCHVPLSGVMRDGTHSSQIEGSRDLTRIAGKILPRNVIAATDRWYIRIIDEGFPSQLGRHMGAVLWRRFGQGVLITGGIGSRLGR
jgi:hypothetical protein